MRWNVLLTTQNAHEIAAKIRELYEGKYINISISGDPSESYIFSNILFTPDFVTVKPEVRVMVGLTFKFPPDAGEQTIFSYATREEVGRLNFAPFFYFHDTTITIRFRKVDKDMCWLFAITSSEVRDG
jgi:hypothetical protein